MTARITITKKSASNRGKRSLRRVPLQRDVLRDVMLSAAECVTWLTLEELARMTSYPSQHFRAVASFAQKHAMAAIA
jgi:hypothetical protein